MHSVHSYRRAEKYFLSFFVFDAVDAVVFFPLSLLTKINITQFRILFASCGLFCSTRFFLCFYQLVISLQHSRDSKKLSRRDCNIRLYYYSSFVRCFIFFLIYKLFLFFVLIPVHSSAFF